ncbi:MAG TPA: ABC transporter ATP-binding protein [Planctomycetota bacterium]|nr:ABC transporter ATP-binding protein [Planctomycetota bacterium]
MIEARSLGKRFGAFVAVRDVSFSIGAGEVVAFLGPNAAGKTTTLRMLTGFLSPSSGTARIAGIDVSRDRLSAASRIGYLPENGPLYVDMTPDAMLKFFAKAHGLSASTFNARRAAVVKQCGLEPVLHKRISKLSRGFRQRVGLAATLLHEPDVLILDEPTNGLDPNQVREVRSMLRSIGRKKTILLSTHVLQEVEAIASRVLLISEGRLVFDGTVAELGEKGEGKSLQSAFRALTHTVET